MSVTNCETLDLRRGDTNHLVGLSGKYPDKKQGGARADEMANSPKDN